MGTKKGLAGKVSNEMLISILLLVLSCVLLSFKKRHRSELSFRIANTLSKQRSSSLTPKSLAAFYKKFKDTVDELDISNKPENIFNCDETSFTGCNRPPRVFCSKKLKAAHKTGPNNDKIAYTVQVNSQFTVQTNQFYK